VGFKKSILTSVNIQKAARKLGKFGIVERLPYERWVIYLFSGLIAVIVFQVFIKHTAVIARKILKYAQMKSRAVLHVDEMYY
jgi:hypothetical protein